MSRRSIPRCLTTFFAVQFRPQPHERTEFSSIPIPDTHLVIRFWDGGMSEFNQYCVDLYDVRRNTHVPLPAGWSFWPAVQNRAGTFTLGGPLLSWERAFGVDPAPSGDEKWSFPEGSYITLRRGQTKEGDLTFMVPVRPSQHPAGVLVARPGF